MEQPPQSSEENRSKGAVMLGDNWIKEEIGKLKQSQPNVTEINDSLRQLFRQTGSNWYGIGSGLQKIIIDRLYRAGGYNSFADYCQHVLGYSRQHAYKLIKVAEFIDRHWAQAENDEQKQQVYRLYNLGLTKLYVMLSIDDESVRKLLREGVKIADEDGQLELKLLEDVSVKALKQAVLNDEQVTKRRSYEQSNLRLNANLIDLLNLQARNLRWLLDEYRQDLIKQVDNSNARLKIIEQHADIILQGLNMLKTPEPTANQQDWNSVVVVTDQTEQFLAVQQALAEVGMLAIQVEKLPDAQQYYQGAAETIIVPADKLAPSHLHQERAGD